MNSKRYISTIAKTLLARKESVAIGESVTSGFFQFMLSQAENASGFFQGGITTYNLGQKARHLNIEPIHAEIWNCVSLQTATEMALGVTRLFTSHWGIGITGYASPLPELKVNKPFAFYAIAYNTKIISSNRIDGVKKQGRPSQEYFVYETSKAFSHLLLNT